MQADPPTEPAPIIKINLDGLAELIWRWFIDHIGDVGAAIWGALKPQLGDIGQTLWSPFTTWLEAGLRASAEATWSSMFLAIPQLMFQLPLALTTNLPAYRAIAIDPLVVAVAGVTLAIVLLGLRTLAGAMVGRDHVVTHIASRILPASAAAASYVALVAWVLEQINRIGAAIGPQAFAGMLAFPPSPNPALILPYVVLWLILIYYAVRLMIRLAYGLFRFLLALVFGPVALILWAIPQAEWVTEFWIREFVGWGTTPLLVAAAMSMAIPLAAGQAGFLGAVLFGMAGLQVAHDAVGLLTAARGGGGGLGGLAQAAGLGARAAGAATAAGAVAVGAGSTIQAQEMADRYGA